MFCSNLFLVIIYVLLIDSYMGSKLVDNNNELALHLLHILPTDHNSFFSPLIISSSMLSLLNGANGKTEKELRHLLNIDDKCKSLLNLYKLTLYNYLSIKISYYLLNSQTF